MGRSLRDRVEEEVYDIINEISDELDLDVPFYPEVYWVGRNTSFNSLGIPEKNREDFQVLKDTKSSAYSVKEKLILIGNRDEAHLSEEAGHFLHYVNSGARFSGYKGADFFSFSAISEMFGYFCSKLVCPDRTHNYGNYADIFEDRGGCLSQLACKYMKETGLILRSGEDIESFVNRNIDVEDFMIHQQGYGLGEKLFDSYISGLISNGKIGRMMRKDFREEGSATLEFLKLKYSTLNYSDEKIKRDVFGIVRNL